MRPVIISLLVCQLSQGAVAFVQSSKGGAVGGAPYSTGTTATTAHNAIVACTREAGQACNTNVITLTDTAGNTYYEVGTNREQSSDTNCTRAFLAFDITANASNAVTLASSGALAAGFLNTFEFSGVNRLHPRDTGGGGTEVVVGGNNYNFGPFSTFVADEALVVCMTIDQVNNTWVYSSGFTNPAAANQIAGLNVLTGEYKVYSSIQSAISLAIQSNLSGTLTMTLVGLQGQGGPRIRHTVTSK